MEAGAFGFSTTTTRNHIGYGGRPLACRNASPDELAGLCHALRDVGRGTIEIALDSAGGHMISDTDTELLRLLTRESGRKVTWLALFARAGEPHFHDQTIAKLGDLLERAIPQVTPRPLVTQGDLKNPSMFASFLSWQNAFNRPVAEQMALYAQPDFREAFLAEVKSRRRMQMWTQTRVLEVQNPALAPWAGKTVQEIADAQGKRPVDAYLDLSIADSLETRYQTANFNYDQDGVERLVADDRFLIGLSDGGAHVDFLCDVGYATALLDIWVRQKKVLTLEKAVQKLTSVPAALFGIPEPRRARRGQSGRPGAVRSRHRGSEAAGVCVRLPARGPAAHLQGRGRGGDIRGGHPGVRPGFAHRRPRGARAAKPRVR